MRCLFPAFGLLALSSVVNLAAVAADEPAAAPTAVETAIDRGLAFLAKDALAWKAEHACVSCHHAGHIVWAMNEAKRRGHAVDEPVLAELTKWMAESGEGRTSLPRPEGRPKALNTKALHFALCLASNPQPDEVTQQGAKLLLETVRSDQTENGSWSAWPETRPPIFGDSDECMTALAALALLSAAEAGDETAKAAVDKSMAWLAATPTDDDPQSVALRLVLWTRLARPADEWSPLVTRIKERQNADGGWSQTAEMASDGWATGQALYALSHAGIAADDAAIARAQAFLIATQREDGSWPMISRPTMPGGEGGGPIPITGAGSAWAVIGLARSR